MRSTSVLVLVFAACMHPPAAGHAVLSAGPSSGRTIPIAITSSGFEPDSIDVSVGETATVVFTRKVNHTCVKRVVLEIADGHNVERDLPVGEPIAFTLTFDRAGELGFSCAMAMRGGAIHVREKP